MRSDRAGGGRGPDLDCCVVVGVDAVSNRRAESPDVPIVALVDAASPFQAVLAQTAGADVVLPTADLEAADLDRTPGLALAMDAASTIARRRAEVARSSRRVGHDLAGAFNVIGLAAEVGTAGATAPADALAHIGSLARDAGADAWRAARPDRVSRRSLAAVDVARVVRDATTSAGGPEVEVDVREGPVWAFADGHQLSAAVTELIGNARRAGARRIRVALDAERAERADIVVADDGTGFDPERRRDVGVPHNAPPGSDRQGLGLATIAEFAADLGGSLSVDDDAPGWSTAVRLSLPTIDEPAADVAARAIAVAVDQATAQADILELVVRDAPLEESLDAIVTAIEHQLPDSACSVLLLRNGRSLHHGAGARLPAAYRDAIDGVAIGRGQGSCGTAAYTGRPVVAADVTTDPNWIKFRDVATEHSLRSCWSTPILAKEGGEVLGTFAVYKSTVWSPDDAAIKLVKRFTYLAAVAIEHHRLFRELAESELRFRSAFEGASAGMALVHLDGSLLKVNPSLSTMLGRSEGSLLHANLLDSVHPDARAEIRAAWDQLAAGHPSPTDPEPTIEVQLDPRLADEPVWVSVSTSIIAAAGERYFYIEIRDITANRRHLAEQRAREAAEAANQAKTDFLTLVSHELRTPLNAILGFAQVMQMIDVDLDEQQRADSVEQIVRAGEHLRDLIDELLDLSRIEAGQLAVQLEPVDTADVIGAALDLVAPLATPRNIVLVDEGRDADRRHVLADRRCLQQVLINLLGNAIKYTPSDGRVDVQVSALDDGNVRIDVTDTGPGIPPESITELFQPFHRLVSQATERSEGTGLGLALTARLMEEMGGTIGVESTVGVGSRFWVEFPPADDTIDERAGGSAATNGVAAPDDSETPAGVLLYVEDDRSCVDVMRAALALRPNIELRTAPTAAAGEAALAAGDIDLVLLDIGLPDRSGWELLADVRADRPDLPVIVLTASAEPVPDTAPAHERLFTKPLDIGDALRAIDVVMAASPPLHDIGELLDPIEQ